MGAATNLLPFDITTAQPFGIDSTAQRRFGAYLMTLTGWGEDIWKAGDGMPVWHAFGELTWMAAVLTGLVRYQHPGIEGTRVYRRSKWRCLMGSVVLAAPANMVLPDVERRSAGAGTELMFPVSVLPLDTPLVIHDSPDLLMPAALATLDALMRSMNFTVSPTIETLRERRTAPFRAFRLKGGQHGP